MKNILPIILIVLVAFGVYYFANEYASTHQPADGALYEAPQSGDEAAATTTGQNGGQTSANGKINIDAVCQAALIRMTFPSGEAAAKFVAECKEGKHPEVIEQYKAEMNLGDGAQI